MNKRRFEKELNKLIKNDILMPNFLKEIGKTDKKSLFNEVNIEDLLKENLFKIINNTLESYKVFMILYLYKFDGVKKEIEDNFMVILSSLNHFLISELIRTRELSFDVTDFINDNFEEFITKVDLETIFNLYYNDRCLKLNENNKKLLNQKVKENINIFSKILISVELEHKLEDKQDYNNVLEIISKLVIELTEKQNLEFTDINYISSGGFSRVYKIGDKVLKVGSKRASYNVPNDKRILKPLIRVNLGDYSDLEGTIEVTELVDRSVKISGEELYQLYKELRDRKIIWGDVKVSNLGYLLKDNTYHWVSSLNEDDKTRGFDKEKTEILKKGEIVIIDVDMLYPEDSEKIEWTHQAIMFERRYKDEKRKDEKDTFLLKNELHELEDYEETEEINSGMKR